MAHHCRAATTVHQRRYRPPMHNACLRITDQALVIRHCDCRYTVFYSSQNHAQIARMWDRFHKLSGYIHFV